MKRPFTLVLGLALLLALGLRVPDLDERPFHNDEAVNAVKFGALLQQGVYRYDPHEFHGPSLHYATLILARAAAWPSFEDTSEAGFRWLAVLFGSALIPLLWLTRDALGRSGTLWAAILTALSPSLVFFSRDYIHEILLVAFTFLLVGCLWRYWRRPNWKWAFAVGGAAGLMHATKETFVLQLAAMGIAFGVVRLTEAADPGEQDSIRRGRRHHLLIALGVWALVWLALFSSFGSSPSGLPDSLRTYSQWLNRAAGDSPHTHPWWFYGERLFWRSSESGMPWTEVGILLLALVGGGAALTRRGLGDANGKFVRWLGLYTGVLFVMYSLIPYKTPWSILGAVHGMVLLAGVGLSVLWQGSRRLSSRVALAGIVLALLAHTAWQAWALSHSEVSSRRNPWAYADTVPDIRNLIKQVDQLAAISPEGRDMNIQVVCEEGDYWPLPYYLRGYSRVGWWLEQPPRPLAPVLIVSQGILSSIEQDPAYVNTGMFQFRHGVFLSCHVEQGLWDTFLQARGSD